ncbi:thioredoxin domain-containing protein [Maribellus maritimus]|uniref:thioredoxin domain-containing protein n=1 Tax=Maribellus maritimus TaxID=2870838 RepID=UPI001EEAFB6B|nr:thioredoxin domain-containing protein [Maribellus maritimus]MCG6189933.1 thioredoxin domain-containing protein [Maribellus maritimus]
MEKKYTNALIHSSSPYLLQHAHNPVNWQPWNDKITEQAQKEDKLILVSIGYAACHWCHVMEHESFEDGGVAEVMNDNFICVKVDREERPDVDHYYMTAVQLMRRQGGWPLNIIALPDGRPVWGGTYFPRETWMNDISAVAGFYRKNREKMIEYAENLQKGIEQVSVIEEKENILPKNFKMIESVVGEWSKRFDLEHGGRIGAPKFPMPVNLEFLLYFGYVKSDKPVLDYLKLTLEKMARGGIYDQAGGGFARYSVDESWKVPHFEKMLYDNGQLLSIYSKAYQLFKNDEFKLVVKETVDFIERELTDKSGAFYSSLDADSEGEEGKFYVWNAKELGKIIGDDFKLFSKYFNVNTKGFWEQGNNILLRDGSDPEFVLKNGMSESELQQKKKVWKDKLMNARRKRARPGLDDKTLSSWNALVTQGLLDAYKAFSERRYLELALKNATFLQNNILTQDGKLFHVWKKGQKSVAGFLEDYALLIQAFLTVFEVTSDEKWLELSQTLVETTFQHFFDEKNGMFFFSEKDADSTITNHFQREDNVIPAANSVVANNLFKLYLFLGKPEYLNIVKKMVQTVVSNFRNYPMAYANWGTLMLRIYEPHFEVVVCGPNSEALLKEIQKDFNPNLIGLFSAKESEVAIFSKRFKNGEDLIYVCKAGVCDLPVKSVTEAKKLLETHK